MMRVSASVFTAAWAAAALVGGACSRHGANEQRQQAGSGSSLEAQQRSDKPGERVDVGDLVAKDPSRYVGHKVIVEGPVANVLSESALAIGEDAAGQGRGLLVLVPNRAQALPQRGRVVVSGTVRRFDRDQLRGEYGAFASTPEIEARYEGHAVLIADSLRDASGREIAGALGSRLPAGSGEPVANGSADRRQDDQAGRRGYPGTDHDRQQPASGGNGGVRDRQQPAGHDDHSGSGADRP